MNKPSNSTTARVSSTYRQIKSDALTHIKAQRRSGLSIPKYCTQHNIGQSTFYGWIKRYAQPKDDKPFIPVLPTKPSTTIATAANKSLGMKVELPQGIILHFEGDNDGKNVAAFIKELATWN